MYYVYLYYYMNNNMYKILYIIIYVYSNEQFTYVCTRMYVWRFWKTTNNFDDISDIEYYLLKNTLVPADLHTQ